MKKNINTSKKPYSPPAIKLWGDVHDLTATGLSSGGGDAKTGTAMSQGK